MSESIAPVTVVEGANYPGSETLGPVTIVGDTVIGAGASVDSKDVQVLAGNVTAIDVVANNIDSVVTDANNIASINTVAALSQQVVAVADNLNTVTAVVPKLNEVNRYYTTYLGASATPPTVRLDGTPLQDGDMYLSTAVGSAGAYVRNLGVWYVLSSTNFVQQTQLDQKVSKSGDTMTGTLNMGNKQIKNLQAPNLTNDAATKYYVDFVGTGMVSKTGSTMTGALFMENIIDMGNNRVARIAWPVLLDDAVSKRYTDQQFIPRWGGSDVYGNLNMMDYKTITNLRFPEALGDAVPKGYVDTRDALKLTKTGDTMTGILSMFDNRIISLGTPVAPQDATSKTYVDTADSLKVSKLGDTFEGNLSMGGYKLTNVPTPIANTDASNKAYVDGVFALTISAYTPKMFGELNMNGNNIVGVPIATQSEHVTNKTYVDGAISGRVSKSGDTMTGSLAMSNNRVTGLASPINAGDASNKSYVDAVAATINVQQNTNTNPPYGFTGSGDIVLQNSPQMSGTIAGESQTLSGTLAVTGAITATGGVTGSVIGNVLGNVSGSAGSCTGNAATATALATGRTIGMTGDVTYTSASFNGSANVTGAATLATTGVTAGTYGSTFTGGASSNQIPIITVDDKGRVTNMYSSAIYRVPVADTADTAQALATGRTIGMTGDVTYTSASFNGTSNVTGTATLANTTVVAGAYGSASAIPTITVDAKGRVTSISTNAPAAPSALATGRTIGMTGDVTYTSASFNGSANVTGTATLATTGVITGNYGGSELIPAISVDAKGRVTSVTNTTISIPNGSVSAAKLSTALASSLATTGKSIAMAIVFGG